MPELPEVETTRRGIAPHVLGRRVRELVLRTRMLRWPIPGELPRRLEGRTIDSVERRAKYLLLGVEGGAAIVHLGMSGSLRVRDGAGRVHDFLLAADGEHLLLRRDPLPLAWVLPAGTAAPVDR